MFGLQVDEIIKLDGYLDNNFMITVFTAEKAKKYVVKISHAQQDATLLSFQNLVL